jgi:hypothetical protein
MKKLVGSVVLPVVGLALLAGCAPTGGTAAIVNGVAIPDSRIVQATEGCASVLREFGVTEGQMRLQVVRWAVIDEVASQFVATSDLKPTDAEILAEARAEGAEAFLADARCGQLTSGVLRYNLLAAALAESGEEWPQTFRAPDIEINPRYGVWDPSSLTLVNTGSLSQLDENYRPRA